MNDYDYELILELYESRNITKTSNKLFVSQPALTKRIKKIEDELGCQLFFRSKKGILFTPVGESIIPMARQMRSTYTAIRDNINLSKGIVGGNLSLGSSLSYCHYRLPQVLKAFTALYPTVNIHINTGQSKDLYLMLQNEQISIAIARGEFTWHEGKVLVSREHMCVIYNHKFDGMQLKDIPYIGRQSDANFVDQISRWRAEHNLEKVPVNIWVDNINSAKNMATEGLGWCILPQICLSDFRGHIEPLYFQDGTPLERSTYILYKNNYFELPQVRLFIRRLLKYEADNPLS